jgi:hypothetical protein
LALGNEEADDFPALFRNPGSASPLAYEPAQLLPRIRNTRCKASVIDLVECFEIIGTESAQMHKNGIQESVVSCQSLKNG